MKCKVLAALFIMAVLLSGCFFHGGDETCIRHCNVDLSAKSLVLEHRYNPCRDTKNYKNMSVPSNYVTDCTQCRGRQSIEMKLSYPNFFPIGNISAERIIDEDAIGLSIIDSGCYTDSLSKELEKFIIGRQNSKFQPLSPPISIGGNLYRMSGVRGTSAKEDIYFYKTPAGEFLFSSVCVEPGGRCHSASNRIDGTPYVYSYSFRKPLTENEFLVIHGRVKAFLASLYEVSQ